MAVHFACFNARMINYQKYKLFGKAYSKLSVLYILKRNVYGVLEFVYNIRSFKIYGPYLALTQILPKPPLDGALSAKGRVQAWPTPNISWISPCINSSLQYLGPFLHLFPLDLHFMALRDDKAIKQVNLKIFP